MTYIFYIFLCFFTFIRFKKFKNIENMPLYNNFLIELKDFKVLRTYNIKI